MPSYNILFFFILISFLRFPPTKTEDSIAIYLYKICSNTTTTTISNNNSAFQFDLRTLLTSLSSKATGDTQFSTSTVIGSTNPSDSVYGLFMCKGDDDSQLCQQCIGDATLQLFSECSLSKQAVIWYDECMVRYSNRNFFSAVDTQPKFVYLNPLNVSNPESFLHLVYKAMNATADEAASGDEKIKYATKEVTVSDSESHTIYIQAQCTPDLSPRDCRTCLSDAIGEFPKCCVAKKGGRVMYPSCNIRYEPDPFYHTISTSPTPAPPLVSATTNNTYSPQTQTTSPSRSTEKQSNRGRTIILIVVPAVILVMLFSFGCYFLKRKARKSHLTILRENFGKESATLEPLQFDFPIIEAATNNFSQENYIGKGGFGKVYKGILLDGQQIAVKRLSETSKQGVDEFKNEVLLIAKLQHRNLVAFIGFCLEDQEKILVYEYVPNKSLDYFLFDSQGPNPLSWDERYNIIGGIAQGIIYLHEHSRLKVIHRDLKPSNVLLDENMIPKISDFGLARIVEINQDQGSTNRIVGT
ncbi:cysteine-rich receptor-like protein kinase 25 isoform X2 [Lotus japonicus]|uniref:cysteine-rich receptor-like protein kinase 25 isoform X2 n=1 Tax=Lotus japonicus TaxID=34305 RepID=UPI0025841E4D|nr:cysteine-rich receptor-like protein kinase 25 isoform X2 [Lotus japonicus]